MPSAADPPPLRRKPPRAETAARENGAKSRGPVTEDGKRRSSMNALAHGLRARRHLAASALGEDAAGAEAHAAAVHEELGAVGPVARHLAETVACSMLRAARAERLEGELLAGLAEGGGSVAAALHADRDARATLALLQRYRREADGELRRSLDALVRLHRARTEALVPDGEEAEAAQDALDGAVAELPAPSEPRIGKIEPRERVGTAGPANDDAPAGPAAAAAPSPRSAAAMLSWYRFERERGEERGAAFWAGLSAEDRAAVLAEAEEERRAEAEGRDPASLHAAVAERLAARPRHGPA